MIGVRPRTEVLRQIDAQTVLARIAVFMPYTVPTVDVERIPTAPPRVVPSYPVLKEFPDREPIDIREADASVPWRFAPGMNMVNGVTYEDIGDRAVFMRPDAKDGVIRQIYNPSTVRALQTPESPYTRLPLKGSRDFLYVPMALMGSATKTKGDMER